MSSNKMLNHIQTWQSLVTNILPKPLTAYGVSGASAALLPHRHNSVTLDYELFGSSPPSTPPPPSSPQAQILPPVDVDQSIFPTQDRPQAASTSSAGIRSDDVLSA
jgi:hypothetical protein